MASVNIPVPAFDLVVFGATGDLASRKILPALYRRFEAGQMPADGRIIGAARTKLSRAAFRKQVGAILGDYAADAPAEGVKAFLNCLDYVVVDARGEDGWGKLAASLRADAILQKKLFSLANVTVITEALSTEVTGDGKKVNGLLYTDRASGEGHRLELEGIFVQIGLLPNSEWLKGTIELSARGEIEIDARGATSLPGVFAAGDVTTVPYKQIVIAMGEGTRAALSAFDHLIRSSVS